MLWPTMMSPTPFPCRLCVEKGCARDGIAPLEAAAEDNTVVPPLSVQQDSSPMCPLSLSSPRNPDFRLQIRICLRRLPCGQADCFFLHPLGQFIELLACAACKQDIYTSPPSATTISPMHRPMSRPMASAAAPPTSFSSILSVSILFPRYVQIKGRRIIPPPLYHGWFMVCLTCLLYAFSIAHR